MCALKRNLVFPHNPASVNVTKKVVFNLGEGRSGTIYSPAHLNMLDRRHSEEGEMAEKQPKTKRSEEYKKRRKMKVI